MKFEIYRGEKESEIFELCGKSYGESSVFDWFKGGCQEWLQQIRYKHWVTFVASKDSGVEDHRSLLEDGEFWPRLEALERTVVDLYLKLEHPTQVISEMGQEVEPKVETGEVDIEIREIQSEKKTALNSWVKEIIDDCENVDTKIGTLAYNDASLTEEIKEGILGCLAHCGDSLKILKLRTDSTCDDVKDPRVLLSNPDWYDRDEPEEEYLMEDESAEYGKQTDEQEGKDPTGKPKPTCLNDERKWVDVPAMDATTTDGKKMKPEPFKLCGTLGKNVIFAGKVEKSSDKEPIKFDCCVQDPNISKQPNGDKSEIQIVRGGRAILSHKDFSERKQE